MCAQAFATPPLPEAARLAGAGFERALDHLPRRNGYLFERLTHRRNPPRNGTRNFNGRNT